MKRWSKKVKEKARRLRKKGLSYRELTQELGVSKSTLHFWIYDLKRPQYITRKQKLEHLANIRPLASEVLRQKRENRLDKIRQRVKKEVNSYPLRNKSMMKVMLSMLYWAEGSKGRGTLAFANTDPRLSLLYITLLRKCHKIDEDRLRVRLHLHYYHKRRKIKSFWSKLLNIPESQFMKIYIKPRSKTKRFRKNFAGICFVYYHSEDLRFEVLERAYLLSEQVAGDVPVA